MMSSGMHTPLANGQFDNRLSLSGSVVKNDSPMLSRLSLRRSPLIISVLPPDCKAELGAHGELDVATNHTCVCAGAATLVNNPELQQQQCQAICPRQQQIQGDGGCACVKGTYNTSAFTSLRCMFDYRMEQVRGCDSTDFNDCVCEVCPVQCTVCEDSARPGIPSVRAGWRLSTTGNRTGQYPVLMCDENNRDTPSELACPQYELGTPAGPCNGNHTGLLCNSCQPGYAISGGTCVECPDLVTMSFGFHPLAALLFMVIAFFIFAALPPEFKQALQEKVASVRPSNAQNFICAFAPHTFDRSAAGQRAQGIELV